MKLGTVLAAASALLLTAQPVMAEATRSASSLPSATSSANVVRSASKVGQSEDIVGVPFIIVAIVGTIVTILIGEALFDIDFGLGIADS